MFAVQSEDRYDGFLTVIPLTFLEMFERDMPSFSAWTPKELAFVEPVIGRS